VVQQARFADGSRRITAISEVSGMEAEVITMQDIFQFRQEGFDEQGSVLGRFAATGFVPRFYDDLQRRGVPVDLEIFREDR
jgi:pilus assembly protein CpaF